MRRFRRLVPSLLAFVLGTTGLTVATALLIASPAAAHTSLRETDPIANASVPTLPQVVRLTFTSSLTVTPKIDVLGPDGKSVNSGQVSLRGNTAAQPVQSSASGTFTVNWAATAPDGHALNGSFAFSVPGSGGAASSPPESTTSPAGAAQPGGISASSGATPSSVASGAAATRTGGKWWPWALGVLTLGGLGTGGFFLFRRRLFRRRSADTAG